MTQQSVTALWRTFTKSRQLAETTPYSAWAFGSDAQQADALLELVLKGVKQGTSSLFYAYEKENEPLPQAGQYNIVLDGTGQARAVILTKLVEILPYAHVSELHAHLEGEGDCSLAYWRQAHHAFFEACLTTYNQPFSEDQLVVYEYFELVYTNEA